MGLAGGSGSIAQYPLVVYVVDLALAPADTLIRQDLYLAFLVSTDLDRGIIWLKPN